MILGSPQQSGIRPGTVPVPLISSLVAAVEWGLENYDKNRAHMLSLRSKLVKGLPAKAIINGPTNTSIDYAGRTPQTLNFSIPGFPSGMLIEAFSAKGICISAGSACHSMNPKPNETLLHMGLPKERALSAIRVSTSSQTTSDDVETFLKTLNEIVVQYGT